MKFCRSQGFVDAEQFFAGQNPETYHPDVSWDEKAGSYSISTIQGDCLVKDGDWIVTERSGEKHLCNPKIFALIYS